MSDQERAAITEAIRAACPSEEQCLADEDQCILTHPIHYLAKRNDVVTAVYAEPGALADVTLATLNLPERDHRVRLAALEEVAAFAATCRTCGKEHRPLPSPIAPTFAETWADPDDGHGYAPPAAVVADFVRWYARKGSSDALL